MICQKAFSITITTPACVDWSTLSAFVDEPGSPVIIGAGSLGQGHPLATTWTQFATTAAGGVRWQTLGATLTYNGPACNCNLNYVVNNLSGFPADTQIRIFAPLEILNETPVAVGNYDFPFTLPDSLGVPYTVTVTCMTNATDAGGNVNVQFTLTTV